MGEKENRYPDCSLKGHSIADIQEELTRLIMRGGILAMFVALSGVMNIRAEQARKAGNSGMAERCARVAKACEEAVRS